MAHFRGIIQGCRGEASRLGSKDSGLDVTCDGWHSGVSVVGNHRKERDVFDIHATSGSGYGNSQGFVGSAIGGYFFLGHYPVFKGHKSHNEPGCPRCKRDIRTLDVINLLCRKCFKELRK